MQKELRWGSARRVAAVSVAVVSVIAASVGVTIWRYESAISRSAVALNADRDRALTETLVGLFWHEREAMREDLLQPSPAALREIRTTVGQFAATSATLTVSDLPAEERLRVQAGLGNNEI